MTDHLSTLQLKRFSVSALEEDELAAVAMHTADCQTCQHQFSEELKRRRGQAPNSFTLNPEFWFRNDHLDFDQLASLADGTLNPTAREIVDFHLKVCEACREDVRSLQAFRKETVRDIEVSYAPTGYASSKNNISGSRGWRSLLWQPTYAVAAIVVGLLVLIVAAVVFKNRSATLDAKKNEPAQINVQASPSPSQPEQSRSPDSIPSPSIDANVVAVLKDGRGEVAIDRNGRVTGLEEVSSISRQEIAQVVLTERMPAPSVLKSLEGGDGNLRGGNRSQSFNLIYPTRRVVIEDRPTFKWQSFTGATSYRVYVIDSKANQVAKSEELSPTETQWKAKAPLQRGQVFSWVVTAIVDGKEIVSPSSSAPEMRFAILSGSDVQELNQLKKTQSHLALGVFYAKSGLLSEAEREFQQLIKLNPQSQLPKKLLQSVRRLSKSK